MSALSTLRPDCDDTAATPEKHPALRRKHGDSSFGHRIPPTRCRAIPCIGWFRMGRFSSLRTALPAVLLCMGVVLGALVCHDGAFAAVLYRCPKEYGYRYTNQPDSPLCQALSVPDSAPAATPEDMARLSEKYAALHCLDPDLLRAVMEVESGMDPDAVSPAGAEGAMQIMPETQRDLLVFDPFNAEESIEAGARYLAGLLRRFQRTDLALAAYNAGPGAVERHDGMPPYEETRTYVVRVLVRTLELKGVSTPDCSSP